MDVATPSTPSWAGAVVPRSILRACYNVYGLDDETRTNHLKRLYLQPKQGNNKRDDKNNGYSCAVRLADDGLAVPRFYGLAEFGFATDTQTNAGAPTSYEFCGALKPYQCRAVDATLHAVRTCGGAIMSAGCGTGKVSLTCLCLC